MASRRTPQGLLGLLGIFWLLSALSVSGDLEMDLIPKYLATCGENLTLVCKVQASAALDIKSFYWMEKKDICNWMEPTNETDLKCESKSKEGSYNLSLTIINVQPKHKGTYHCKLRAKEGVKNSKTILRVQNCVGDAKDSSTADGTTCTFSGVFPKGSVEWTRGTENLTHQATTQLTENSEGYFNVVSTIKVKDPSNTALNCSLLMPIENAMNETIMQTVRSLNINGSYMLMAHWVGVLLAIALGMLML